MARAPIPLVLPVVVAGLCLTSAACGTQKSPVEPDSPPDPSATFTRVQQEVFTPSCAFSGCHGGSSPQLQLDLTAGRSYGSIVGVKAVESTRLRIAPGDPAGSYLVSKIKGDATISGSRMPLGGDALPADKVQLVVDWVRRGAPND